MLRILFLFLCLFHLSDAKESLYVNLPKDLPSHQVQSPFGEELIHLIDGAQKEIVFAIYGLREQNDILEALKKAKKRGVLIKGVVDSDSHGKNYYSHTDTLYALFEIRSDHKSAIMHNKFFVFDQKILWSGSSNISDTGTGGYNANAVVVIEDKEVAKAYIKEFKQMFDGKFGRAKTEHSYANIRTQTSTISIYFSPKSHTYEKAIRPLIQGAKHSIFVPIFYLTHEDLSSELVKASKRGVDVKVILDASAAQNDYSKHEYLREQGIAVKVENFGGKMHAKSMIVDDRYFIAGSMNFTKAGNDTNDENTLIIDNEALAKSYNAYFSALWHTIPHRFLSYNPSPEGLESGNACFDGIDNDFDGKKDQEDPSCQKTPKVVHASSKKRDEAFTRY